MKAVFKLRLSGLLWLTTFLAACSVPLYAPDELAYIESIRPKTENPLIIAFGDSLTNGFTIEKNKTYPKILEERLGALNCPHEVLNFGFNGDTTDRAVTRVRAAVSFERVRIFVLELGANDVMKSVPASEIRANLQKIISLVKAENIKILLCGFEPPDNYPPEYRDRIKKMYADLASENDVAFLPSFMDEVYGKGNLMLPDNIHPNESGVKIIERKVFEKIEPLLECGR